MNIKITADSTCDLSKELIAENEIDIFPLYVAKGNDSYRDCVDIWPADIVRYVAEGGSLCSTSAVNVGDYIAKFATLSGQYDAVIHISLGSGFSSAYQNACIAAGDYPNIYVVDSCNLSTGHGLVVMEACRLRKEGLDAEAIVKELNDVTGRVETSFLLNHLDYMVKGGRCSMVAALGANLLQLRPSIEVADGKMKVTKKYRGSWRKCMEAYIRDRITNRDDIIRDKMFYTYSETDDMDTIAFGRGLVDTLGGFEQVWQTKAGCTITCHCGPDCFGVLFIRKK